MSSVQVFTGFAIKVSGAFKVLVWRISCLSWRQPIRQARHARSHSLGLSQPKIHAFSSKRAATVLCPVRASQRATDALHRPTGQNGLRESPFPCRAAAPTTAGPECGGTSGVASPGTSSVTTWREDTTFRRLASTLTVLSADRNRRQAGQIQQPCTARCPGCRELTL